MRPRVAAVPTPSRGYADCRPSNRTQQQCLLLEQIQTQEPGNDEDKDQQLEARRPLKKKQQKDRCQQENLQQDDKQLELDQGQQHLQLPSQQHHSWNQQQGPPQQKGRRSRVGATPSLLCFLEQVAAASVWVGEPVISPLSRPD